MAHPSEKLFSRVADSFEEKQAEETCEGRESWIPPENATLHTGATIPPGLDFFAPPPPEIGQVRTAYSTLKTTSRPLSTFVLSSIVFGVPMLVALGTALARIADLERGRLRNGTVILRRKGAKQGRLRSEGEYRIPYGSIANGRVFLMMLDRWVGIADG